MSGDTLDAAALRQLDEEPRQLLNAIDSLRSLGVDSYVELPQIIVVGDQSSGKSSVLEAISRFKFPSRDGLCTRFATELVLSTSLVQKVRASIIRSGPDRGKDDAHTPTDSIDAPDFSADGLAAIFEKLTKPMGLGLNGTDFTEDVLRVEIQGPDLPQLTLIDLPGFYQSGTEEQSTEGRKVVDRIADKYMGMKRSIMLAVISARSGIANQSVLRKTKEYDPLSQRTLGIITKPDSLEPNSYAEGRYLQLAKNEESSNKLVLGWHVLRNRSEAEAEASSEERDRTEAEFLNSSAWKTTSPVNRGVAELRGRLSTVLFNHIKQSLPDVISGIEENIRKRRQRLVELGEARSTPAQHRAYLSTIAKRFESLSRNAILGFYTDEGFFGESTNAATQKLRPRKLRASIRAYNRLLAVVLAKKGCARAIHTPDKAFPSVLEPYPLDSDVAGIEWYHQVKDPPQASWDALKAEMKQMAIIDQGTEFPGSGNPWHAFAQFRKQAAPWKGIATLHIDLVTTTAEDFVRDLVEYVVPEAHTRDTIWGTCVVPFFDKRREVLASKLDELLEHYNGEYPLQMDTEFLGKLKERVARRDRAIGRPAAQVSEFDTEGLIDTMLTYYEVRLICAAALFLFFCFFETDNRLT